MIRGITFAEQMFYSADFAHYQDFFLNHNNGITLGCIVTSSGIAVNISEGYFILQGRLLNIETPEVIESSMFEKGFNRIVYEIDLSKENTVTEFRQGSIKVLTTEELVQENLLEGGEVYQFPFCKFQWSGTAISEFVTEAPTLVLDNIFAQVSANYDSFNELFEEWFASQKANSTDWLDNEKADFNTYADARKTDLDNKVVEAQGIVNEAQEVLDSLNAGVYSNATLLASGWSGSGTYSFESTYPHSNYDIEIQPNNTCTTEQLDAWGEAKIAGSATSNVYTALGLKPTVDIPVILRVVRKA